MEINVAYGANDKFSKYTYTSILSLLLHSKNSNLINCFLFTVKDNKRSKEIKKLENIFNNFKFKEIICDEEYVKSLKISKELPHLTYYTYFRFFMDGLNLNINKIIYIDSDTIINDDISLLYREDLSDKIVGVISDSPIKFTINTIQRIGLKSIKYFNAGVLLIDLEKRKDFKVSEKCFKLLEQKSYPCGDQDALNITLRDYSKRLNGKYNVQTGFFEIDSKYSLGFEINYYENAVKKPVIIHYTGTSKPRFLLDNHPYRRAYDKIVRYAIFINLKHFKLYPITYKDFVVVLLHTIEHIIFPKYIIKKNIRKYINCVIHKMYFL